MAPASVNKHNQPSPRHPSSGSSAERCAAGQNERRPLDLVRLDLEMTWPAGTTRGRRPVPLRGSPSEPNYADNNERDHATRLRRPFCSVASLPDRGTIEFGIQLAHRVCHASCRVHVHEAVGETVSHNRLHICSDQSAQISRLPPRASHRSGRGRRCMFRQRRIHLFGVLTRPWTHT